MILLICCFLIDLPLDKMTTIWQTFPNAFPLNKKFSILIQISLKFVPKGPIDNKSALVQVKAWCQTGDKPLPEPIMLT